MWLLLLLILIFLFFLILLKSYEQFISWPTRITRPTRNMSYDLRGDVHNKVDKRNSYNYF